MAAESDNPRPLTLTLSDRHIQLMIKHHDLKEADAQDMAKVAAIAQRLFDEAVGLPEPAWHEWDDWVAGLE